MSADLEAFRRAGEALGYALERERTTAEAFAMGLLEGTRRAQDERAEHIEALETEREVGHHRGSDGSRRPELLADGTLDPDLPSPHEVVAGHREAGGDGMKIDVTSIKMDPSGDEAEVSFVIGGEDANPRPSGTYAFTPAEIDPENVDENYDSTPHLVDDLLGRIGSAIERRLS